MGHACIHTPSNESNATASTSQNRAGDLKDPAIEKKYRSASIACLYRAILSFDTSARVYQGKLALHFHSAYNYMRSPPKCTGARSPFYLFLFFFSHIAVLAITSRAIARPVKADAVEG